MSISRFDSKNLFIKSLTTGISLFCGAGFSVLSQDKTDNYLPVGNSLLDELKKEFPIISTYTNLSRACTKIERTDKNSFYSYLDYRFAVEKFDDLYLSLTKVNIINIFTTNIDDLWYKIYDSVPNNVQLYNMEKGCEYNDNYLVKYYPLHGCVRTGSKYIFGATEIASAFSQNGLETSWRSLAKDASEGSILFWGWNFDDSGPIEAMYGNSNNKIDDNFKKWVLLYKPSDETVDYLNSLGFNIIIGDTKDLLEFIKENISLSVENESKELDEKAKKQLLRYCIPENDSKLPSYSIKSFFTDYTPQWSHIYSNQIPKLRVYNKVNDTISKGDNIIVIGIRCSGKTTLLMQLLLESQKTDKKSYHMVAPSIEQVKSFKAIIGDHKVLLFVDDCFRDTEAVRFLLSSSNIQAVLFDRDFNYERQYHRLSELAFTKIDITEIEMEDAQRIIDIIPEDLKNKKTSTKFFEHDPTIVNLLANNMRRQNFTFISKFREQDKEAADVFLMICYVHSCGVPCSFDMIYSFIGDENCDWKGMYSIIERAGHLVKEYDFPDYDINQYIQDYYRCRSRYLAEKIIMSIPEGNEQFRFVLERFTKRVPQYKICQYDKFRRSAYDAEMIVNRAFSDILQGKAFYELCLEKDNSEYIFQQAALYFAHQKDYKSAFMWIDMARSLSHYNRFSIDSTYAQIFFDVNIDASREKSEEALEILNKCCKSDKRKIIHYKSFSERAIKYHDKYPSAKSLEYLKCANSYIESGLLENDRSYGQKVFWELKGLEKSLNKIIK